MVPVKHRCSDGFSDRLSSSFATTWNRQPSLPYSPYIKKCCDILEKQRSCKGDEVLAWQVRVQRIVEETSAIRRGSRSVDASQLYQQSLMIKGMEAELNHWETIMPKEVADTCMSFACFRLSFSCLHQPPCHAWSPSWRTYTHRPSLSLSLSLHLGTQFGTNSVAVCTGVQFLLARVFLTGATLLKLKRSRADVGAATSTVDADELRSKVPVLRKLYGLYSLNLAAG